MAAEIEVEIHRSGLTKKFDSKEALLAWIQEEQTLVQNLIPNLNRSPTMEIQTEIRAAFDRIRRSLNRLPPTDDPNFPAGLNNLRTAFDSSYSNGILFPSGSAEAEFLQRLKAEISGDAVVGAIAAFSRLSTNYSPANLSERIGYWRALGFASGIDPSTSAAIKNQLDDLLSTSTKELQSIKAEHAAFSEGASDTFARISLDREAMRQEFSETASGAAEQIDKDASEHFEKIEATLARFQEQLKLKAPVKYWSDKARNHKSAIRGKLISLLIGGFISFAIAIAIAAGAIAWGMQLYEHRPETKMSEIALLTVPLILLTTTLAIWVTRILTRLYLSEHHLAIDAEFRSTMTECFLALIEESAIDEKSREQILVALFRPASDGIVKDDGAPMLSPSSLISRPT